MGKIDSAKKIKNAVELDFLFANFKYHQISDRAPMWPPNI